MSLQCHIPSRYICENCSVTSYICRNGSRGTSQTSHYLVAQWQPNWAPSDGQELQDPRPQVIIPYPVSVIILFPVQRTVGAVCSSNLRQVVTRVFGQTEKCFGKLIDDVFLFPFKWYLTQLVVLDNVKLPAQDYVSITLLFIPHLKHPGPIWDTK